MSITDILSSLRDYFTGGQSEADRAADAAANIAINTGNVINGDVTPLAPAPFVPTIPNFDNQSVNITPIPDVNTPSPALQAADLALQSAQAGTNTGQPITLPEAPAPAVISPAPQAPIAPVEFGAGTNVVAPVVPPVIQAAQDLLPAGTQNVQPAPIEPPAPAPSIFNVPEILPSTGNTPQKNTAWDEIKNLGKDLLGIYNAGSEQAASRKKEEDVKQAFGYAPGISFRDASNVIEIGKIYAAMEATNGDRVKQQEIINKMLPETGYTGPSKTPEQFVQFVNDLQAASPKGQSPVEVKSLAKEYSGRFGVTEEFAQDSINRGNDFLSGATAKLTTELYKLIPADYSRYSGDVGNRVGEVVAQLADKGSFYNSSITAIEATQKNAQQAGQNTAEIQKDLEIATTARNKYMERHSELIIVAQRAALKSEKGGQEAAEAGITAIAEFLREGGYKSVDEYMNKDLPVIGQNFSPQDNMSLLASRASVRADDGILNTFTQNITLIGSLRLNASKEAFRQRDAEENYIKYAVPSNTTGLSDYEKIGIAVGNRYQGFSKQNALEGVSDLNFVDQVLTPEGVGKIQQGLNYLSQNKPEIGATILSIWLGSEIAPLAQVSYAPKASNAAKVGAQLWNKASESFIIGEAINGIANSVQPYITKQQEGANAFFNFAFDFGALPVQATALLAPRGSTIRSIAPKIIRIGDELGEEGLTNAASYRTAKRQLLKDPEWLAMNDTDKMIRLEQVRKEVTPRIIQEDIDQIAREAKGINVAYNEMFKTNPEVANQMMKGTLAKYKTFEDIRNIINTTGGLSDAAKLQIADSQALFNSLAADNTVNVADMVRRIYGIDAPVFYGGFYSGLLPTEIKDLPGLAVSDIQYAVPGKVYDIAGAEFNPNRVTVAQVEQLKVLSPDINVVTATDGTLALDDVSKDSLGIVETKQFKLQAATTKDTNEIVDNLIVKGIIEEGARSKTEKLANLIEKTASKILCP